MNEFIEIANWVHSNLQGIVPYALGGLAYLWYRTGTKVDSLSARITEVAHKLDLHERECDIRAKVGLTKAN